MELREIDTLMDNGKMPLQDALLKNKVAIKQNIINAIQKIQTLELNRKITRNKQIRQAAAAIIILSAMLGAAYKAAEQNITKQGLTVLPDGSYVQTKQGTTLSYNTLAWDLKRTVQIKGDGHFKVRKGSKFVVTTALGHVEVLGTVFDVHTNLDTMNVECHQGKVGVQYSINNQNFKTTLAAGEKAECSSNSTTKSKITQLQSPTITPSEPPLIAQNPTPKPITTRKTTIPKPTPPTPPVKKPILEFDEAHINQVIKEIEHNWNVNFQIEVDTQNCYFTGKLNPNSLDTTLWIMTATCDLDYKIKDNNVTLTNQHPKIGQ